MERIPMTAEGHAALQTELKALKSVERPSIIAAIAEARIDVSKFSGTKIRFGATVTIVDVDTEDEQTYKIVGEDEASVKLGKISVTSPIARALIGKEEGDEAEVSAPSGARAYEIAKVEYK